MGQVNDEWKSDSQVAMRSTAKWSGYLLRLRNTLFWCFLASILWRENSLVSAAPRLGGWLCRAQGAIVSRGDFINGTFAPFVSPRTSSECPGKNVYFHNTECVYEFEAPKDHHIYVEFVTFDLDINCRYDYVYLESAKTSRQVCSSEASHNGRQVTLYDISKESKMRVEFVTNNHYRCGGFSAYFSAYKPLDFSVFGKRKRRSIFGRSHRFPPLFNSPVLGVSDPNIPLAGISSEAEKAKSRMRRESHSDSGSDASSSSSESASSRHYVSNSRWSSRSSSSSSSNSASSSSSSNSASSSSSSSASSSSDTTVNDEVNHFNTRQNDSGYDTRAIRSDYQYGYRHGQEYFVARSDLAFEHLYQQSQRVGDSQLQNVDLLLNIDGKPVRIDGTYSGRNLRNRIETEWFRWRQGPKIEFCRQKVLAIADVVKYAYCDICKETCFDRCQCIKAELLQSLSPYNHRRRRSPSYCECR